MFWGKGYQNIGHVVWFEKRCMEVKNNNVGSTNMQDKRDVSIVLKV